MRKKGTRAITSALLASTGAIAGSATIARAQNAEPHKDSTKTRGVDSVAKKLGGVHISANKNARLSSPKYAGPIRDIPQTITVVSKDVMGAQGVTTLRDALRNVPGITINAGEGGSTPGDKFNVRGFSAASDIYIDGVRDVSGYSRETFNIEQIEVSEGPSSSYAGRGSTGGSINLVTKTPSLRAARHADLTFGSAQQRRATVDINQPLSQPGPLGAAFRLNAMTDEGGVAGNEVVHNKSWGVAPSFSVGLGSPTQALLSYVRTAQNNIPAYGIESFNAVPTFDTRKFYGLRSLDFEHVETNQLQLRIDHQFGNGMQLRNQTTRGHGMSDRIVTSASPVTTDPSNPDSARRGSKTHINDNDILANQTNLTASFSTGAVDHSVVTGVEFIREDSKYGRHVINGTAPAISDLNDPPADVDYHPSVGTQPSRVVRANSVGAYAFETMRVGEKLEINGGLRWDRYAPRYRDSTSLATGFQAHPSSAVSGRAAVVLKPTEDGSVYVAYSTSFNPSNENLSADALNNVASLDPEKSRSYEIGSKWDLFKQRLAATMAIFRTEKVNARTSDPNDPSGETVLSGKQRVDGAQVGLAGDLTSKLNVMAGYSFLEGKILESLNPTQAFTNVPKHSVTSWATYRVSNALSLGGGARYLDKRLLRINGTTQVYVPSYHAYDAMASYRMTSALDLQLNLYNLTDKLYYDSGRMWVPAAGRSVSVTTAVKF
jgi:catecholate siderophore receptor